MLERECEGAGDQGEHACWRGSVRELGIWGSGNEGEHACWRGSVRELGIRK
jgi:hypothetical protein